MVTSSAPCIFKHTKVGLKQFGKGRAAAAVNYQTNSQKCEKIITVNLPNCNRHALRDAVQRYEDALPRKDSVVAEMFTVGFDRELRTEHRELVAQRYLWRMTAFGRSRAWACLHHNDPGNPHAHIGYLDRDIETGRPVQLMTASAKVRRDKGLDATGTEFARRLWAEAHKSVYAEFGYERTMDHRSKERQQQAEIKAANENARPFEDSDLTAQTPLDAPTQQLEEAALPAHEQELVPEDDMPAPTVESLLEEMRQDAFAKMSPEERAMYPDGPPADLGELAINREDLEQELQRRGALQRDEEVDQDRPDLEPQAGRIVAGEKPVSVTARVRAAYQLGKRLQEARAHRVQLNTALAWKVAALSKAKQASETAAILAREEQAFERSHTYGYHEGKAQLRGIQLPSWGFLPRAVRGWQSAPRKKALEAQKSVASYRTEHEDNLRQHEDAKAVSDTWEKHTVKEASTVPGQPHYARLAPEQQAQVLKDMEEAELAIDATRQERLEGVTAESVWESYKAGEVTAEEALSACQALGFDGLAVVIQRDVEQAQEQEEGLGM